MDQTIYTIAKLICETDWNDTSVIERDDFQLLQFSGTAFDSSYECVKVILNNNAIAFQGVELPKIFVAKKTNIVEYKVLEKLNREGVPVPNLYGYLGCKNSPDYIMFEEFIEGHEIYNDSDKEHWKSLAQILAKIHSFRTHYNSTETCKRIIRAHTACEQIEELNPIFDVALKILHNSKISLTHGDMFPTNILVRNNGEVIFIDWHDSGCASIGHDLGRLTGLIDIKNYNPLCPYEEIVRDTYYEAISDTIDYDSYLKVFYAGQFIELGACLIPEHLLNYWSSEHDNIYACLIKTKMLSVSDKFMK